MINSWRQRPISKAGSAYAEESKNMAHLSRRRGGLEDVRASSSLPTIIPSLKFEFSRPLFDRELPLNFLMFVCRRLAKDKNTSHIYILSDKLVSVTEAGKVSANFDYHPDGQIASVTYADGRRENYLWDGLALIHRNGTDILNEPAITGGNPVLSGDKVLFNDLLGNTLGVKDQSSYQPIRMTAFGESDNADAFFTGKPLVGELGYTFLFRNYRPEQGKWQTADPLGYPDGWNNLAYVRNRVLQSMDPLGLCDWVSPDGLRTPVPFGEDDAEAHTPPGYTYEPCESEIYVDTSSYQYFAVSSGLIIVNCSESPFYLEFDRCPGDKGNGKLRYAVSYCCGETLDNHPGYEVFDVTLSVEAHPVIESFNCFRKEIIGYELPDTMFAFSYSFSAIPIDIVPCSE